MKIFSGNFMKNAFVLLLLLLPLVFFNVEAQSSPPPGGHGPNGPKRFLPNFLIVTAILLTFLFTSVLMLIFCIKFMNLDHRPTTFWDPRHHLEHHLEHMIQVGPEPRFSGIDKTVIESLPFFTFSSLAGSKQGLACAVCLADYEESETLRLLPKCKHGFHLDCIDEWLEKHSTCPLCRVKVTANDVVSSASSSFRFLPGQPAGPQHEDTCSCSGPGLGTVSSASSSFRFFPGWAAGPQHEATCSCSGPGLGPGLFVEREESRHGSLRFSEKEDLAVDGGESWRKEKFLHRFNHRIVVPGAVMNNRWSNVSFNDLMVLNSEMIRDVSSSRFGSVKSGELEDGGSGMKTEKTGGFGSKESKIKPKDRLFSTSDPKQVASTSKSKANPRFLDQAEKRSMSEIVVHPRFMELGTKDVIKDSLIQEGGVKEERRKKLWLPIARKTVKWFADRETRSIQSRDKRQNVNV